MKIQTPINISIIVFNIIYITILPVFGSVSHLLHAADYDYKKTEHNLNNQIDEQRNNISRQGDNEPPIIEHSPFILVYQGNDVLFEAIIKDENSISGAYLYYRTKGKKKYKKIPMKSSGNSLFKASVPTSHIDVDGMEYYIEAADIFKNKGIDGPYPIEVAVELFDPTPGFCGKDKYGKSAFYCKWWFWTIVASASGGAIALIDGDPPPPPDPDLNYKW